ncbi:MAG: thioredoxin family protein, partial [Calditrichaeota bacterium]|nr:thioredoxin family protein [Calditrichota bacterium]
VIFWCNHCPYVIKNEERVIALGREFMPRDVAFYLISVNDTTKYPMDDFPSMQRRSREKSYPFPYLFDESQVSAVQFGAKTTPHVFLFDAGYRLVYRGAVDDNTDYFADVRHHYLRDALASLLAGKPDSITTPATQPIGCSIKWK